MGVLSPILFWPAAGMLAALVVLLILWSAAGAARRASATSEDPARAVYRRQLEEVDDLAARGLLAADELQATHAEAARRLLATPAPASTETAGGRIWPFLAAGAAALAALGLYLWIGSPGMADQPFQARLAHWRASPLGSLRLDEVIAELKQEARARPNDPRQFAVYALLGRLERQAGDPLAASIDYRRAAALHPDDADLWAALGDALAAAAGDKGTPEAEAALRHALTIDPDNQGALYYLGGLRAAAGDRAEAAGLWRKLAAGLPDQDPRKPPLLAAADRVEKGEPVEPEASTPAGAVGGDQAGFIRAMVATLKARLDAHPDDPAGWARLVRSYRVLGDASAEATALARARTLFATRPRDLAPIEAEAKGGGGAK